MNAPPTITRDSRIKVNAMLNISSGSAVFAPAEAPAITSGTARCNTGVAGRLESISMRLWLSYAAALLQELLEVFAVLYLLGAVAIGVAVLFYTLRNYKLIRA